MTARAGPPFFSAPYLRATWFGSCAPGAEPIAPLLAAHQPDLRSRVTRCELRGRAWRPLSALSGDGRSWTRCPACLTGLDPPRPGRQAALLDRGHRALHLASAAETAALEDVTIDS